MTDIVALKAANAKRWAAMHMKADRIAAFDATAKRLCAPQAKTRYSIISQATGVPWWVVAVIHERESSQNFKKQLAQGDPLDRVSTNDPAGRGPFLDHPDDTPGKDAFYRGALDALIDCAPHLAHWTDWSAGGTLTATEDMNGFGYANMGVPSAYVWSGTNQYVSGKYVADHVYRPSAVDVQEGCAPLIARMMAIDSSITFGPQTFSPALPSKAPALPTPRPAHGDGAAAGAAGGAIAAHQAGLSLGWIIAIAVACCVIGILFGHALSKPAVTTKPQVVPPKPQLPATPPTPQPPAGAP